MNRKRVTKAGIIALFVIVPLLAYAAVEVSLQQNFSDLEKQYQIPTGILNKFAMVESNGNPNAKATSSSAAGLFQWTSASWTIFSARMTGSPLDQSERFNPLMAARVTAYSIKHSQNILSGVITGAKVDMTVGLYLGHFLGEGGASTFLNGYVSQPGGIAACALPKPAAANPSVFGSCSGGKSYSQIINYFANKLKSPGVVNIAGNFGDSSGNSLAKSAADMSSAQYAPAGTSIPKSDPEQTGSPILNTPATLTSPPPATPATTATTTAATTATTSTPATQVTTTVAATGPSAGMIFAQPKIIPVGQYAIVSIATVNMSSTTPCVVVIQGKSHQVNYSQTGLYQTLATDRGGLTFTLSCVDSKGAAFNTSDAVTVI